MKCHIIVTTVLMLVLAAVAVPAAATLSPAQKKLAWAQKEIRKNPNRFQIYNAQAMALSQRARETGNPQYYIQAGKALDRSQQLAPDNFNAQKIRVWLLLGQHEFARALGAGVQINKRMPDDVMVYGMLTDAHIELGNYREAEAAAQWMLDLRPGNIPGLTRAAYLRELFGDHDGAIEFMVQAYNRTPAHEDEQRAWLLTQIANLHRTDGNLMSADRLLRKALTIFPDYHYALAGLAKVCADQQDFEKSAELYHRHYKVAPHPENLYLWAKALTRVGRSKEAGVVFNRFEEKARLEIHRMDNANRELILYYAQEGQNPAEALRIANIEFGRRHDVHTRDILAWALYANGKYEEARRQMETALAVGIRNARFFYHAGAIAAQQGDTRAALGYFRQAIDLNPHSQWAVAADKAKAALQSKKDCL